MFVADWRTFAFFGASGWTGLFEREIAKFTIAEFKAFSETKDIWWAPVSSARGVLMNVQVLFQ